MELWQQSATELAANIRSGACSAEEAMAAVLERMRERNPELNAVVYEYPEQALERAREADATSARGEPTGPLHGVPVTVKVNVDLDGTPNDNGLPALANNIAPGNSPVVQHLLDAGAIVFGKTNTPELSMRGNTDNPLHGITKSPWGRRVSPGGSSGGAGSACAASIGPIHHGNDIAGSLRFPASACGCATVKPSQGRVAAYNPSAPGERTMLAQLMSVQGVICREVADVRLATAIIAQGDPRDPWWTPAPFDGPRLQAPLKVAVTTESHGYPIHPEIVDGVRRAAAYLEEAGYVVEEVPVPSVMEAARGWLTVALYEVQRALDPIAREHGSEAIQNSFDYLYRMGDAVDADGYLLGLGQRTAICRAWSEFLAEYPLVLTPFLMRPMYDVDHDETYEGTKDLLDSAVYSYSMNYMGLPAGNIPIGLVDERPCGVQIVGRRFREDLILDAMDVIESRVGVLTRLLD